MKKIIAALLLCCFALTSLTGCGNEAEAVQEILWTNDAYDSAETYDVIVVGGGTAGMYSPYPIEVTVGGATVFVVPVEQFVKV